MKTYLDFTKKKFEVFCIRAIPRQQSFKWGIFVDSKLCFDVLCCTSCKVLCQCCGMGTQKLGWGLRMEYYSEYVNYDPYELSIGRLTL